QSTYYHPERDKGTLMCHVQHIAHDNPFLYPGLQDLTASVDFTTIAKQGLQSGFTLSGYCHLAGFLLNCGLLDFITTTNAKETSLTTQQILHLLLSPTEMGEMFKVLALGKNISTPLLGYREFDRRASLFTTLNNAIDTEETATALNAF